MIYRFLRYLTFALALALIGTAIVLAGADARSPSPPSVERVPAVAGGGGGCQHGAGSGGCDQEAAARGGSVAKLDGLAQGCCGGGQGQGGHDHGGQPQGDGPAVQAKVENGAQTVRIAVSGSGYNPGRVRVRAGQPVRLVFVAAGSLGCADRVVFPTLGLPQTVLKAGGETVVSFTPKKAGTHPFSCPMNMTRGEIVVE